MTFKEFFSFRKNKLFWGKDYDIQRILFFPEEQTLLG